jgi:hypothetical protein
LLILLASSLGFSYCLSISPYRLYRLVIVSQRLSSGAALVNAAPLVHLPATLVINWLAFIYFAFNKHRLLSHKKSLPNIVLGRPALLGFILA